MRYYRLATADGEQMLTVETRDGVLSDLTSIDDDLTEIEDLALSASISKVEIDELAMRVLDSGVAVTYDLKEIVDNSREHTGDVRLDIPFEPPEVWAAGVTYETSEFERRRESDSPDVSVFRAGARSRRGSTAWRRRCGPRRESHCRSRSARCAR